MSESNGRRSMVSMRLRPQEQDMYEKLSKAYGLYGSTNAVRAAGRILMMLRMDAQAFVELLHKYETEHPEAEPIRFEAIRKEE